MVTTLKNKAARYSEMLLVYQTTRRHVWEAQHYSCITPRTECTKNSHMIFKDEQSVMWGS
jgi:hypothetical protein